MTKLVDNTKGGVFMLDLAWKLFSQTGNIDTYLLLKELERDLQEIPEEDKRELAEVENPSM